MNNYNNGDKVYAVGDIQRLEAENNALKAEVDQLLEQVEILHKWRELALQFDNHRMEALSVLKSVVASKHYTSEEIKEILDEFLNKAPASGKECLAEIRAEAVDRVINSVGGYITPSEVNDPEYADGFNSAIKLIKRQAILIRQKAKENS